MNRECVEVDKVAERLSELRVQRMSWPIIAFQAIHCDIMAYGQTEVLDQAKHIKAQTVRSLGQILRLPRPQEGGGLGERGFKNQDASWFT